MSGGAGFDVGVERSEARAVVRNATFRNLLYAAATSSIGDWVGLFALIALAETLGGTGRVGALAVSFMMVARVVPTLFFAPLAGVFVDRWDRKRVMVVTDVVRGVVMLGIAFVGDVIGLVLATFVIELAAALFIPAKDATVPTIVREERLVQANQLAMLATYATLPLGALLAALVIAATERLATLASLVARFPEAMAFLEARPEAVPIILNALSFFGSIWFIRRMDVPDRHRQRYGDREEHPSAWAELRDGLRFIAGMPLIRALVVGIMTAFLAAGVVIGVGTFFASILNAGDSGFATLGFVVGVGLVAGIAGAGPLSSRIAKERLFAPGVGVAGAALVVAALMPNLWLAAVPALVMGVGAGVAFILGYTMLQEYSHDEVRGRTFAAFNAAVRMAMFAALIIGPLSIVVLGVELTNEQIAAGGGSIEDIEEFDDQGRYPYQLGGVRLTLIGSGVLALGGAVWTGSSIATVLRRRERGEPDGGSGPGVADVSDLSQRDVDVDGATGAAPVAPLERGVFVVLEGGEGAGKSTQVGLLVEAFAGLDRELVVTREPGGTPTGEAVRDLLLDVEGDVAPRTEALLYAAARAQHAEDVLRPAVDRGAVVLCDRYVDSSIVYQGVGRDLGIGIISDLNRWATTALQPDLTVLLDVPADVGLARAGTVDQPDRLEAAGLTFHEQVNAAFRDRAAEDPDRYLVVDAREPVDLVHLRIRRRLAELVPELAEGTGTDRPTSPVATDPVGPTTSDDPDPVDPAPVVSEESVDPASATQVEHRDVAVPPDVDEPSVVEPRDVEPRDDGARGDAARDDEARDDEVQDDGPADGGDAAVDDLLVMPETRVEQGAPVPAWLALPDEDGPVADPDEDGTPS